MKHPTDHSRRPFMHMGGRSEGVGLEEAVRRLEEIENGRYNSASEDGDETTKSRGAVGGKAKADR